MRTGQGSGLGQTPLILRRKWSELSSSAVETEISKNILKTRLMIKLLSGYFLAFHSINGGLLCIMTWFSSCKLT